MKNCKITAIRKACYKDLIEKYENPLENPCQINEGDVFITDGLNMPKGFCESAWMSIYPFVMTLSCDGEGIFGCWMKNKRSALVSCNDGFRPVSFLIETID